MAARARILIVDDDPRIVAALRRALVYEGYDVDTAGNGTEGLRQARLAAPDLVVLDVMMPGLDGFEVARRLRAGGDVGILMLTARDSTADRVQGLDSGADDYLVKPCAHGKVLLGSMFVLTGREQHGPDFGGAVSSWHEHPNACVSPLTLNLSGLLTPFGNCPPFSFNIVTTPMLHVWRPDMPNGAYGELDERWAHRVAEGQA